MTARGGERNHRPAAPGVWGGPGPGPGLAPRLVRGHRRPPPPRCREHDRGTPHLPWLSPGAASRLGVLLTAPPPGPLRGTRPDSTLRWARPPWSLRLGPRAAQDGLGRGAPRRQENRAQALLRKRLRSASVTSRALPVADGGSEEDAGCSPGLESAGSVPDGDSQRKPIHSLLIAPTLGRSGGQGLFHVLKSGGLQAVWFKVFVNI